MYFSGCAQKPLARQPTMKSLMTTDWKLLHYHGPLLHWPIGNQPVHFLLGSAADEQQRIPGKGGGRIMLNYAGNRGALIIVNL